MRALSRRAALVAAGSALALTGQPAWAAPSVGEPSPALVVPQLDGRTFDLGALRGKTVIVNFWATWCVPCRTEMPTLDGFYRRYHDRGLEMIGVSADRPRDRDDVIKVMRAFGYPAAMMKDARVNGFGAPGVLPVTYVVDANGTLRAKFVPNNAGITQKDIDDAVLPLLNY